MNYLLRNIKIAIIAVIALYICSCNHKQEDISYNPNFTSGLFFYNAITKSKLDSIYAAYHKIEKPGVGDLIMLYKANAYYYRGLGYNDQDNRGYYEKAISYVDKALNLINSHTYSVKNAKEYAELNILKGFILFNAKKYDEAYLVFYQAKVSLQSETDNRDHFLIATLDNCLGNICYTQYRYQEAKALYLEAVNELQAQKERNNEYYPTMQGNLDNIGLCYSNNHQPDSAIYYYNKGLQFIQNNRSELLKNSFDQVASGVIYGNRAKAYEDLQQYDLAKADYYRDIRINGQQGFDRRDLADTKLALANLYLKTNHPDSTEKLLNGVDYQSSLDVTGLIKYYKLKADYFMKIKNDKNAVVYLKKYIDLKNSRDAELIKFNRSDFSKDFAMLDQRYKVAGLQKENQFKNFYLVGAIIFCLMCVVITLIYLQSRKRSRIIITNMDIYNKQLQLAVEALEQGNFDFNKMMNVMGHDLKNPLVAIRNIAEIMLLDPRYPPESKEELELISNSSRNLILTINDLLDVRNKFNFKPEDLELIDLEELLINSVALMKYSAREKHQVIYLETIGQTIVKINRVKIWRVINNLLVNAIKFSKNHAAIYVSMNYVGNNVQIVVLDKGIGVPDKLKDKLFDLFTEARRHGTNGEPSFGLGLHTSKQIMEAHDGKIWFESTEHNGSVFYLSLPVQQHSKSKNIA